MLVPVSSRRRGDSVEHAVDVGVWEIDSKCRVGEGERRQPKMLVVAVELGPHKSDFALRGRLCSFPPRALDHSTLDLLFPRHCIALGTPYFYALLPWALVPPITRSRSARKSGSFLRSRGQERPRGRHEGIRT